MTEEQKKEYSFKIGMALHNIAISVSDRTFQDLKPWLDDIEQVAKEIFSKEGGSNDI